jgi:FAD/FMN-containing dehydrogenase
MQSSIADRAEVLAAELRAVLGTESVVDNVGQLELLSSDVYSRGVCAALAIVPTDRTTIGKAIELIAAADFAIFPRGGGMSYTGGYVPNREDSVVIDMSALNKIVAVNAEDMTVTVEAGVTWKQIYEVLTPLGLRLPFFGTFSGSRATVGGGMSNGALFMGTARYGTGAEIVLGMEVVTAGGRTITTGQAGFKNGRPFYRTYGPDLTGLFVHDAGALGIKTLVSLRMIEKPAAERHASFVLSTTEDTVAAMSDIARSGRAEEVYVFDPEATRMSLDAADLKADVKRLINVVKSQGSIGRGIKEGLSLVGAGRNFVADDVFTLHVVCAASSNDIADADMNACRLLAEKNNAGEIANSMPKAARANPFEPLNGILGSGGSRWAALNAKVAHSDALQLVNATNEILARHEEAMRAKKVTCTRLCIAISNHAFSFEPVLRWDDEWLPLHKTVPEASHLATFEEPPANLEGRELVDQIRQEIVELFAASGAASNQIGKTYQYFSSLNPETASLVLDLKKSLDPKNLMNPGVLQLPTY